MNKNIIKIYTAIGAAIFNDFADPYKSLKVDYNKYISKVPLKPIYVFARGANRKRPLCVLKTIDIGEEIE